MAVTVVQGVKESIEKVMRDLRRLTDIRAVVIARRDGLVIASDLPDRVDGRKIAAMSAAIVGTSEVAAKELNQGGFMQSIVECREGKIVSIGAGEEAILVALIDRTANIGLVLIHMERASKRVDEVLGGMWRP